MIVFVSTFSHRYTHASMERRLPFFRRASWPALLARRRLPRAVYIFSDFDRLGAWPLEVAAGVYRQLAAAGCRVLNDPATSLQRLDLLQRLHDNGFNNFVVWPATQSHKVDRFPVFIRTQAAHRGVIGGLLEDLAALDAALTRALAQGHPLRDLMICEYCAEPVRPGLFRKLSIYRVGDRMVPALNVHARTWIAKQGEVGSADQQLYDDERHGITENIYAEALRPAFDLASIDYGRADFAVVGGSPQVYEINTNPTIAALTSHPFPVRMESDRLSRQALVEAFEALDSAETGHVHIAPPMAQAGARRRFRLAPGYQWNP